LLDATAWREALRGVDVVFHLAAQTSVTMAMADLAADLRANVYPLAQLLQTCRNWKFTPTVLFAGTATEAGLTEMLPVTEDARDEPITIYDIHKLTAELYLKAFCAAHVCRGATLRLANVYGPGPTSGPPDRGVLNAMIRKALCGEQLTVFGDGSFLRDYVYVYDVARAFVFAASRIERVNGQHFLIGSGIGWKFVDAIRKVAERVTARTGKSVSVKHIADSAHETPIDKRNFVADISRFSTATGWRPRIRLEEGIDLTIESLVTSPDGS
jgi:nucleoside-diphosphate-sugar epimerase